MRIKTSELEGVALNWAVALATGRASEVKRQCSRLVIGRSWWEPSRNWVQCGPLIEHYCVDISAPPSCHHLPDLSGWYARSDAGDLPIWSQGKTPLIAACRAIVAVKLGDEVEAPDGLVIA